MDLTLTSIKNDTSLLKLALAIYFGGEEISIDTLVSMGVVTPTVAWRFMENAEKNRWVRLKDSADGLYFEWIDESAAMDLIEIAECEKWISVASHPIFFTAMVRKAEKAFREKRELITANIYRALVMGAKPSALPLGEKQWVDIVISSLKLNRVMDWLDVSVLNRALNIAVSSGRLDLQAPLIAARGARELIAHRYDDAIKSFVQAKESLDALKDPSLTLEINLYIVLSFQLAGRLRESLENFEYCLGDCSERLFSENINITMDSTYPTFVVTALTYVNMGQKGRGVELAYQLMDFGKKTGEKYVEHLGEIALARVYAEEGDVEKTAYWAEKVFQYIDTQEESFMLLWYIAPPYAWAAAKRGDYQYAAAVLIRAINGGNNKKWPYYYGDVYFELLEMLEENGADIGGLVLSEELLRYSEMPHFFMKGIAYRYLAKNLLKSSNVATSDVIDFLDKSVYYLTKSGSEKHLMKSLQLLDKYTEFDLIQNANSYGRERDLINRLFEIGEIFNVGKTSAAVFGTLLAAICRIFNVEKAAIFKNNDKKSLLAMRGGSTEWLKDVVELPERSDEVYRVTLPFVGDNTKCSLVLENRHCKMQLYHDDHYIIDTLRKQLESFMKNYHNWKKINRQRELLALENVYYREKADSEYSGSSIIGNSALVKSLKKSLETVAPSQSAVLITGETGVGKELVAREIHKNSTRSEKPFISVHIASITSGLVGSTLFGHERGAFTGATQQRKGYFELAHKGTIFLDEIGELRAEDQVMLLRILQDGCFERLGGNSTIYSDFRLIAATNRDLRKEVEKGNFRSDLFYRLNVFPIHVPPLRERTDDIFMLVNHFLELFSVRYGKRFDTISGREMEKLVKYEWPGNIREFKHTVEKAVLLSAPPKLLFSTFENSDIEGERFTHSAVSSPGRYKDAEKDYFRKVLVYTGGKVAGSNGAAALSGLKISTFNWKVKNLGLYDFLDDVRKRQREKSI